MDRLYRTHIGEQVHRARGWLFRNASTAAGIAVSRTRSDVPRSESQRSLQIRPPPVPRAANKGLGRDLSAHLAWVSSKNGRTNFLSRSHRVRLTLHMIDTADSRAGIMRPFVLHTWEFACLEFFGRSPVVICSGTPRPSHPYRSHVDQPVAAALFLSSQWFTHSIRRVRRRDPETSCCACIRRRIVAPSVAWSRKSASCLGRTATHSRKPLYSSLPHSDRNA